MRESPRLRRLRSDFQALLQLQQDSSILSFHVGRTGPPDAPDFYVIEFEGFGLFRNQWTRRIEPAGRHRVEVRLTAAYPRSMPDLRWKTAIFHPNISSGGVICLGGYSTHWTPSLGLDELSHMLWDMVRYQNYDIESPYNREAAEWARDQDLYRFPVDARPLRDLVASRPATPPAARQALRSQPPIVEAELLFPDQPPAVRSDLASAALSESSPVALPEVRSSFPESAEAENGILFLD